MIRQSTQHLIIAGGGHAHVFVLKSLAMRPEPHLRLTVVSPSSYATYSGMVPGVLAGQYRLAEAQIDVRALAARARAAFVPDRVTRIDPVRRTIELAERPPLAYDWLSLDIGSLPAARDRVADGAPAVTVKPIEVVASGIEAALAVPPPAAGRCVVVVGAGAGGTEIAFALAARLRREGKGSVTLCDQGPRPVPERGRRTSVVVARALREKGITFVGETEVARVDAGGVLLADGRRLPADLVVWAVGAAGPTLLAESRLPVDARGFLRVGDDLRCGEHAEILAAGDCATLDSYPDLPKAGVYAVRQGPVLAANLRLLARGAGRLQVYRPQPRFLSLMNTGDGAAILSYGPVAARGRWAWRLKDRIDRAFVARYARPALDEQQAMGEMIACGGCAAKIGADLLGRVLDRLHIAPSEGVLIGLDAPDDAAVFTHPPGTLAVATADVFPPFADDLYVVGEVAAVNAASDLYAMGAEGAAAIALVSLPQTSAREDEALLEQVMRGALAQLAQMNIPLVGGHTIAGEQALVGFAMHGWVRPDEVMRKAGARAGDRLVLTKPLGTGVVLAAARAGQAPAEWVEAALAAMRRSNGPAMRILRTHGVRACTDVTGFGLAGHLAEMLRASGVDARLDAAAIPALPGARELLAANWRSSFHASNERATETPLPLLTKEGAGGRSGRDEPAAVHDDLPLTPSLVRRGNRSEDPLWLDPQTSGGLLAAVPPSQLDALRAAFEATGEALYVIGEITDS